jgi:Mn2+/Fe2+ NRAMP family transporter
VKKLLEVFLGIITGIGGFLEAGSLATSAQAGAQFGYQLIWALVLGAASLIVLVEGAGRLAVVSHRTVAEAIRERFGFRYFVLPLVAGLIVSFMVLASELAVTGLALQLVTGVSYRWWAPVVALCGWFLLWKGNFGLVEKGTGLLGLISLVFLFAALELKPDWGAAAAGAVPTLPRHDGAQYWFGAVSILGASISPYLYFFYSSGAVEEQWKEEDLPINRITAGLGMGFGAGVSIAVLITGALVFLPREIQVAKYEELAMLVAQPFPRFGFALFALAVGITCFGAAAEIALAIAYLLAQGWGIPWSENQKPAEHARFSLAYTAVFLLAPLLASTTDPLKLTNLSMAATAASLPVSVLPLLVLLNDQALMGEHRNRPLGNIALVVITLLASVLLVVSFPLAFLGGG